jgi:hypothetical protein
MFVYLDYLFPKLPQARNHNEDDFSRRKSRVHETESSVDDNTQETRIDFNVNPTALIPVPETETLPSQSTCRPQLKRKNQHSSSSSPSSSQVSFFFMFPYYFFITYFELGQCLFLVSLPLMYSTRTLIFVNGLFTLYLKDPIELI